MAVTIRIKQPTVTTIRVTTDSVRTLRFKDRGPQGIQGEAGSSEGDMLQSVYDTDGDGKVNASEAADTAPWAGITGKPDTYPPSGHAHPYEPADATILKEADLGVSVAAFSHAHDERYYTAVQVAALLAGKSGTDHTHAGVYEPADDTILKVDDIGGSVASAVHSHDDRYYTEAELDAALAAKASSGHDHTGIYEPADATILKDGDIGISVAAQEHTHVGVYEPVDATILRDADIGVSIPTMDHTHGDELAAIDHNHDTDYAPISHEHTIDDINTGATAAERVLASQGNGSAYWKELETDYATQGDVVALVIALS